MGEILFQPFPMITGRRAQAWRHQPSFLRPRHFHAEPELNLVVRGFAKLGVGNRVVDAGPGCVVFFYPGQDHVLLEASADLELHVVALEPELAERTQTLLNQTANAGWVLLPTELRVVHESLMALAQVHDATAVESVIGDMFRTLSRGAPSAHVLTRRALQFAPGILEASCEEMAQVLRVDPSVLSRRFRQDVGVTLVEFRARHRLMEFVRIVAEGQSMTQAAIEAGFGSYAQCHRVFSRMLGCAPQRYFAGFREQVDATLSRDGVEPLPPQVLPAEIESNFEMRV